MELNQRIILTDCDGVLLEWEQAFKQHMFSLGYEIKNPGVYSMSKMYGMPYAKVKKIICDFNKSDMMAKLLPLRNSLEYVKKLNDLGYEFHVITSQTDDERGKFLRTFNLLQVFGKVFYNIQILDCGADKHEALEPYRDSGCYWIEDKPENADLGVEMGLNTLMMTHGHNENHINEKVTKVDCWEAIYNKITGE